MGVLIYFKHNPSAELEQLDEVCSLSLTRIDEPFNSSVTVTEVIADDCFRFAASHQLCLSSIGM